MVASRDLSQGLFSNKIKTGTRGKLTGLASGIMGDYSKVTVQFDDITGPVTVRLADIKKQGGVSSLGGNRI